MASRGRLRSPVGKEGIEIVVDGRHPWGEFVGEITGKVAHFLASNGDEWPVHRDSPVAT